MENEQKIKEAMSPEKSKIHKILAESYLSMFLFFLAGVYLDSFFSFKKINNLYLTILGVLMLLFGTFLIYWSQSTNRHLSKENLSENTFKKGPYRYSRNPTHWGLFLIVLGFGLATGSLFLAVVSIVAFLISKIFFLQREEGLLEKKYGTPYIKYKKSVRF